MISEKLWLGVGFGGQALFAARFLVQWWHSERSKRSVIPMGFWYCSLGGGATLLIYAIHRREWVFMVGQASGLVVYLRNMHLIRRERARQSQTSESLGGTQPSAAQALSASPTRS
jgi:lipid-A-disaccharide synthase-like uncharacterized protein